MTTRNRICLGLIFLVVFSSFMVAAGEMTVEQARELPGVVKVTQNDGSVAYYKDYNDYNSGRPLTVEEAARPVIGGVRSQIIEIQANQDQRNVGFDVTGGWTVELYGGRDNLEVSYDVVISLENGRYVWRPVASTFRAYGYHLEPSEYLTPEVLQGCWHRNGSVIIHFNGDSHACDFNPVGTYFEHYHPGADGKMVFRRSAVSVPSAPTQTYTSGGQGGQTYSGVANSTATAEEILEYKRQLAQEYGLQMDEHGNYSGGWGRSGYGGVFGGTDTTGAMGLD